MSLSHEFFLIPNEENIKSRSDWYYHNRYSWKDKVELSDEIIYFMMDFINWIQTFNPETKQQGNGLNYYGVTYIYNVEANKLLSIVNILISLFNVAPDVFSLRGQTVWNEDDTGEGYWERTRNSLNKTSIMNQLEHLKELLTKVTENYGYLMHYGI